jgi:nucleoid-associated protein YgaU
MSKFSANDRLPGPTTVDEVSLSAKRRWKAKPEVLADCKQYRPPTLGEVARELDGLVHVGAVPPSIETKGEFDLYEVKQNDALRKIAKEHLGDANLAQRIFDANRDKLESIDRIYVGQILRIPKLTTMSQGVADVPAARNGG